MLIEVQSAVAFLDGIAIRLVGWFQLDAVANSFVVCDNTETLELLLRGQSGLLQFLADMDKTPLGHLQILFLLLSHHCPLSRFWPRSIHSEAAICFR